MNYIETTAPLTMDLVKEQFEDKEIKFIINYEKSELKGKNLLVYASNLELNCEIDFHQSSYEEKEELIREFLSVNCINNIDSLRLNAAHVISKYFDIDFSPELLNSVFSDEELTSFINNNKDLLEKWKIFLTSTMVFNLTSSNAVNEEYHFNEIFNTIDDPSYIGRNVVTLFSIPTFMEKIYSKPIDGDLYYFKQQFEECMYKGESLFYYFCTEENTPFVFYNMLLSGDMKLEDLEKLKKMQG
jgi:hypothetical protein